MGYAAGDDVDETLDRAETMIFEVARTSHRRLARARCTQRSSRRSISSRCSTTAKSDIVGVPTGYRDLDDLLLGLQPSTLVDRRGAARPGQVVVRARCRTRRRAHARKPVLFFSMEMGHLELTKRLLAAEARIEVRKLRPGAW